MYVYIYIYAYTRPFFRKKAELVVSKSERLKVRPGTGEKREKVLWINARFSSPGNIRVTTEKRRTGRVGD